MALASHCWLSAELGGTPRGKTNAKLAGGDTPGGTTPTAPKPNDDLKPSHKDLLGHISKLWIGIFQRPMYSPKEHSKGPR